MGRSELWGANQFRRLEEEAELVKKTNLGFERKKLEKCQVTEAKEESTSEGIPAHRRWVL